MIASHLTESRPTHVPRTAPDPTFGFSKEQLDRFPQLRTSLHPRFQRAKDQVLDQVLQTFGGIDTQDTLEVTFWDVPLAQRTVTCWQDVSARVLSYASLLSPDTPIPEDPSSQGGEHSIGLPSHALRVIGFGLPTRERRATVVLECIQGTSMSRFFSRLRGASRNVMTLSDRIVRRYVHHLAFALDELHRQQLPLPGLSPHTILFDTKTVTCRIHPAALIREDPRPDALIYHDPEGFLDLLVMALDVDRDAFEAFRFLLGTALEAWYDKYRSLSREEKASDPTLTVQSKEPRETTSQVRRVPETSLHIVHEKGADDQSHSYVSRPGSIVPGGGVSIDGNGTTTDTGVASQARVGRHGSHATGPGSSSNRASFLQSPCLEARGTLNGPDSLCFGDDDMANRSSIDSVTTHTSSTASLHCGEHGAQCSGDPAHAGTPAHHCPCIIYLFAKHILAAPQQELSRLFEALSAVGPSSIHPHLHHSCSTSSEDMRAPCSVGTHLESTGLLTASTGIEETPPAYIHVLKAFYDSPFRDSDVRDEEELAAAREPHAVESCRILQGLHEERAAQKACMGTEVVATSSTDSISKSVISPPVTVSMPRDGTPITSIMLNPCSTRSTGVLRTVPEEPEDSQPLSESYNEVVYTFGLLASCIATSRHPWSFSEYLVGGLQRRRFRVEHVSDSDLAGLIGLCTGPSTTRPTLADILCHPFVRDYVEELPPSSKPSISEPGGHSSARGLAAGPG
ncbi:hypothetical protein GMRT_12565 [Giardia muris]|uniref:Protein kinase domain-containing protein n=1 Tax=Giardia muris TaxID=5742 RepID=A0A4Z1T3A4_GIAMU|nr:hypothetical protein GMRT_12565 [Giardia muris]|eukprot:TNJ28433.1 hypothetical protein GMRT_12565 [Giardia muris]